MAQAAELLTPARASETKLVAGVCFAHLVSHYYMLMLAPLFAFIRADFGVTYTELSLALTTFNVVSAVSQTPVSLLFMQRAVGWRGAFLCSALLGVVAALVLAVQGEPPVVHPAHPSKPRGEEPASWQLLLSPPILLNLLFFVVLSMVGGGLNQ